MSQRCCQKALGFTLLAFAVQLGAAASGPQLLGTGFGRTGTSSLAQALIQAKWAKMSEIYSMRTILMGGPGQGPPGLGGLGLRTAGWMEIYREHAAGRPVDHLFRKLFKGYKAIFDFPACAWWKEIHAAFPGIKVIHTSRSTEQWYASSMNTSFPFVQFTQTNKLDGLLDIEERATHKSRKHWIDTEKDKPQGVFLGLGEVMQKMAWERLFGKDVDPMDPNMAEHVMSSFRAHEEQVKEAFKGRNSFLDFHASDGWPALCKLMKWKHCPTLPFPHRNPRGEFYNATIRPILDSRLRPPTPQKHAKGPAPTGKGKGARAATKNPEL